MRISQDTERAVPSHPFSNNLLCEEAGHLAGVWASCNASPPQEEGPTGQSHHLPNISWGKVTLLWHLGQNEDLLVDSDPNFCSHVIQISALSLYMLFVMDQLEDFEEIEGNT